MICADWRNLQKDKHHCNTPPIWALCWCGQMQSSLQWRHVKTTWKKAPNGLSDSEKQEYLVWWTSILSIMFEGNSSAHHMQSIIPKVKCAGGSLMLWSCSSAAGTEGLIRVEEKLNAPKYWDSLNENLVQSIQNLRRAEGSPSNRTMDLNTQQEWLIHNSVNVFEWPSHSLSLNPIKYF